MVGTELGSRYRIDKPLGQGGMGRVFEATDLQLGRRVAIKLIRDDLDDPAARERFLREARAAAALSHPNACQLYEVSEHEGQPFLVMELLEGEPLSARLERGPMAKEEAAAVIQPLMSALIAFHGAGLIHRDLKPSNVFLTAQGVKLLDFGLARHQQHADTMTMTSLTMPGAVTGTVRYMAPEQITGDPIDARADVFALGVMLFEMLTGRIPFEASTNVEWFNAVLKQDPPSLGVSELASLDPIVTRALQRRPEDRFESVQEMSSTLAGALNQTGSAPVAAPGPGAPSEPEANGALRTVVLPFRLFQSDPELDMLQHGVPEALTALLSGDTRFRLISNRLGQEFADSTDLVSVGRTLKVDRLIAGSIMRAGNEMRVTVQLVNAADGSVEWSKTSEHAIASVLALQDEICREIVDHLPEAGGNQDSTAG